MINNSSRTARVYQKDNHFGRHVCVGADGGSIHDLRSYQLNDVTHSLKTNHTPCGACTDLPGTPRPPHPRPRAPGGAGPPNGSASPGWCSAWPGRRGVSGLSKP
ncbi:hypothetical protein ACIRST_32320 [Kitasatospora sp. NPDC101447]|uniref:hypothetical protein n=1 Tax=Kitasatospora sp. NPDC101447 TaxID=3364102 RepID=UPI00381C31D0